MDEYISKDALQKKLNRKKAGPATIRGLNSVCGIMLLFCEKLYHDEECSKDKDGCYYMKELDKSMICLHNEDAPQL